MTDFTLSKTLSPSDFEGLTPELAQVDRHFTAEAEQHPMRRWEYAMALKALRTWGGDPRVVYDIGGAGSPFRYMIPPAPGLHAVRVVDPAYDGTTLASLFEERPRLADVVFCLSVLEHIEPAEVMQFLYQLHCLVAPGGLLFLTVDYWDRRGVDTAHFHWMRKQIFNIMSISLVTGPLSQRDFHYLGGVDFSYHGNTVYDYSFASVAMVKRQ